MRNFLEVEKVKGRIAHDDFKSSHDQFKLSYFQGNCQESNAFQRLVENADNAIVLDSLADTESMVELFTKNQKKEQKTNV